MASVEEVKEALGKLPEGFFILDEQTPGMGHGTSAALYYKGPNFDQIIEPGGNPPEEGAERAFLAQMDLVHGVREIAQQFREIIKKVRRQLGV